MVLLFIDFKNHLALKMLSILNFFVKNKNLKVSYMVLLDNKFVFKKILIILSVLTLDLIFS